MVNSKSNSGHRQRLRERFLNSGLQGFHDYEVIELLLTLGTPRADCKQPAKDAVATIDVKVHDHLIIAGNDFYSFADNNLI